MRKLKLIRYTRNLIEEEQIELDGVLLLFKLYDDGSETVEPVEEMNELSEKRHEEIISSQEFQEQMLNMLLERASQRYNESADISNMS